MAQTIYQQQLDNGLTILAEPMPWLESAAFALSLPAGSSRDPATLPGLGNFTSEMVQRGCGEMDSREFNNALENRGVTFSGGVSNSNSGFRAAMLADQVEPAMRLFADLVRRPLLPADQIEEGRQVCLQEIRGIEDDLAGQTLRHLRRRLFPDPFGRTVPGTTEAVSSIAIADITEHFQNTYGPEDAIISVAGRIDWPQIVALIDELFGDWPGQSLESIPERPEESGYLHVDHQSSQTHIALGYPSVPYSHPDYFLGRGAVGVLSDGMSSRLFTEMRENRGLCYAVFASYHSLQRMGGVECYVGTTTDKAQESLEVLADEIAKIADGVQETEVNRLKARYKSSLIMQQESSNSRAAQLAAEWRLLDRVRTLDEVSAAIDALSPEAIGDYLVAHPPSDFRLVTLGAKTLETTIGVS